MTAQIATGFPLLWLPALAQARPSEKTRQQEEVEKVARTLLRKAGRPLLKAADVEELEERLDALLESDQVPKLRAKLARVLSRNPIKLPSGMDKPPFDPGVMGPELEETVARAQRYTAAILEEQQRALQTTAMTLPELLLSEPAQRPFADLLRTFPAPAAVLRRIMALEVGWLYSLAVMDVAINKTRVNPSIARVLVERWEDASRLGLELLASAPGSQVPATLVPLDQRLDVEAEKKKLGKLQLALEKAARHAKDAGADVFPPPSAT